MRNLARAVLLGAASFAPFAASAHPGPHRNEAAWVFVHAVTNADHLLVIGGAAALIGLIAANFLLAKSSDTVAPSADER